MQTSYMPYRGFGGGAVAFQSSGQLRSLEGHKHTRAASDEDRIWFSTVPWQVLFKFSIHAVWTHCYKVYCFELNHSSEVGVKDLSVFVFWLHFHQSEGLMLHWLS